MLASSGGQAEFTGGSGGNAIATSGGSGGDDITTSGGSGGDPLIEGTGGVMSGGGPGTGGSPSGDSPLQSDPGDEGDGVFEDAGPYPLSAEASGPINGAPKGELLSSRTFNSPQIFSGWSFSYQIYVPAQYEPGKPAALAVFQDGVGAYGGIKVMQMFENLMHAKEMPVTIVLFIKPGSGGRSENYDTVSDRYGKMLIEEMIPSVLADYDIVEDPEGWAIAGFSSGGSAAFTAAWFWPDNFRKVSSNSGSFTGIRGADKFPQMIRDNAPKPIRVTLRSGTNDLDNQFGSWLDANFAMASALEEKGYHYRFTHGTGGHDMKQAAKDMANEWRWLWRGFKLPDYD